MQNGVLANIAGYRVFVVLAAAVLCWSPDAQARSCSAFITAVDQSLGDAKSLIADTGRIDTQLEDAVRMREEYRVCSIFSRGFQTGQNAMNSIHSAYNFASDALGACNYAQIKDLVHNQEVLQQMSKILQTFLSDLNRHAVASGCGSLH